MAMTTDEGRATLRDLERAYGATYRRNAAQTAAIVRANRGIVDYRLLSFLTGRSRTVLKMEIRGLRAAGLI